MEATFYLNLFLDEGREQLQELGDTLLALERAPGDVEALNAIFRTVHTFKSMADTMGYADLAELTHRMEGVMELLRDGEVQLGPDLMQLLLHCVDALEQRIEDVSDGRGARQNWAGTVLQGRLEAILSEFGKDESCGVDWGSTEALSSQFAVKAVTATGRAYRVGVVIDPNSFIRSARALMVVSALETLGEVQSVTPTLEEIELDDGIERIELMFLTDLAVDGIREAVTSINEVVAVDVTLVEVPAASDAGSDSASATSLGNSLVGLASGDADHEGGRRARLVRVSVDQLDILLGLARGVSVNVDDWVSATAVEGSGSAELLLVKDRMDALRNALVVCRELPFEAVFSRFPRMVQELASELGKQVEFDVVGGDLPCDRLLLDELSELVVHLLRNSLDHGLEAPAARETAGKVPSGCLRLAAYSDEHCVKVVVSDDGRGIDPARVLASAIAKGCVSEAESQVLSRQAILDLIMQPGFSTAAETTRISGRGIGMDAVKAKAESLGGTLVLTTELGRGCEFTLSFPRDDGPGSVRSGSALSLSEMSFKHGRTVRVNADHLDELVENHREVSGRLERVEPSSRPEWASLQQRIRGGLDRLGTGLRMLSQAPFETIFNRYPRMVRELAHELGKQVTFEMHGAELRFERALIDEANDLVVHLLRNSLDHGLELPNEREAAGKSPIGRLTLWVERGPVEIVLGVKDDGRGIDRDKVLASAIRRGVLTVEEGRSLGADEILDLITREGVSTAEQTTRLSGRGIGMDVVKAKVLQLGGRFVIESELGAGCTFKLCFPLNAPSLSAVG